MKNRILSIALAFSLLAAVFVALSTSASTPYTGSVTTTDNSGTAKTLFFYNDNVYVNAELKYENVWTAGSVTVEIRSTATGAGLQHYHVTTNDPDVGWNNGSHSAHWFDTGSWTIAGDMTVYDIVLYQGNFGEELARSSITVRMTGLTLSPPPQTPPDPVYYPGEEITITYITTHTTDMFYTQIINDTGVTMVNWTAQIAPDGYIGWVWKIAADFPDGHFVMNVRDATSHAIWETVDVYVQKYFFEVSTDRDDYLVGENATIRYTVLDQVSMTPFTDVQVSYSAVWANSTGNSTWENSTLASSSGTHVFTIPANANVSHDVVITYWANETGTSRSAMAIITLAIERLYGSVMVDAATYDPGDMVTATVHAFAGGSDLPDATVNLAVEKNGTLVSAYGATGLVTDPSGIAVHSFILDPSAAKGTYVVNVSISKLGFSIVRMTIFDVEWGGELLMQLDKAYYYGGDEVKMTFRTIWNNQEITTGSVAYKVTANFGIMVTGNTSTNEASFAIPDDYSAGLDILAQTNKDGYLLQATDFILVHFASLVLTADTDIYRQGDKITFHYEIVTSLAGAELAYSIVDDDGVEVASGEPAFATSGSFSYQTPDEHASVAYEATMTLTSPTGAFIEASAEVEILADYALTISIGKSGYASGDFKPGQTLKIHYSIDAQSNEQLPLYKLVVEVAGDPVEHSFLVTEPQGVVELKLPKTAIGALTDVSVEVWNPQDPMAIDPLSDSDAIIMINSNLGAWDKSVGGMRAIDFTLLVLIIVMILLLIIAPFLKGRMGGTKTEPAAPAPPVAPKP